MEFRHKDTVAPQGVRTVSIAFLELTKEIPNVSVTLIIIAGITKIVKYTYSFFLAQKLLLKETEEPEEIVFFGFRWIRKHTLSSNGQAIDTQKKRTKDKQNKDK